jgi:hypothetical protein
VEISLFFGLTERRSCGKDGLSFSVEADDAGNGVSVRTCFGRKSQSLELRAVSWERDDVGPEEMLYAETV